MERREEDYKRLIYEEEEGEKVMKNVLENFFARGKRFVGVEGWEGEGGREVKEMNRK